jgi:hypothetical protein
MRRKLLVTVAVIWLAGLAAIGVLLAASGTDVERTDATIAAENRAAVDQYLDCSEEFRGDYSQEARDASIRKCGSFGEFMDSTPSAIVTETEYEWSTALVRAAGLSLLAVVVSAGVLIWTRPVRPTQQAADLGAPPLGTTDGESVVSGERKAQIAASLRQLKSLHEDGVLTDAEYEQKRSALVGEL